MRHGLLRAQQPSVSRMLWVLRPAAVRLPDTTTGGLLSGKIEHTTHNIYKLFAKDDIASS